MPLPERKVDPSRAQQPGVEWIDPEFVEAYPSLKAFLFDRQYSNGKNRVTGSISIFTKMGCLTAAINDNDRGYSAFVNAGTWVELLFIIDQGILNDSLDWKVSSFRRPQNSGGSQQPPY